MDNRYDNGVSRQPETGDISAETLDGNLRRVADITRKLGISLTVEVVDAMQRPYFVPRNEA